MPLWMHLNLSSDALERSPGPAPELCSVMYFTSRNWFIFEDTLLKKLFRNNCIFRLAITSRGVSIGLEYSCVGPKLLAPDGMKFIWPLSQRKKKHCRIRTSESLDILTLSQETLITNLENGAFWNIKFCVWSTKFDLKIGLFFTLTIQFAQAKSKFDSKISMNFLAFFDTICHVITPLPGSDNPLI